MRRAGVSAFGFGGTNFHAVLEEYIPHKLTGNGKSQVAFRRVAARSPAATEASLRRITPAPPPRLIKRPCGAHCCWAAASEADLAERLRAVQKAAAGGRAPAPAAPAESDLRAPERLAIDYADAADLADKCARR